MTCLSAWKSACTLSAANGRAERGRAMLSQQAAGQFWAQERFADYSAGDLMELQPNARDLFLREPRDRPELPFFDSDSESYGVLAVVDLGRCLNRKCWQCCFEATDL